MPHTRWTRRAAIPASHRRRWAIAIVVMTCLLTCWSAVVLQHRLTGPFQLDALLRPQDREPFRQVAQEFDRPDEQVVMISGADSEARERFADQLVARLQKDPAHFTEVITQTDAGRIRPSLLYYLNVDQLRGAAHGIQPFLPLIRRGGSLFDWLQQKKLAASAGTPFAVQLKAHYLKLLQECLDFRGRVDFRPPWEGVLKLPMPDTVQHLWEGENRLYLTSNAWTNMVLVRPVGDPVEALAELRKVVRDEAQHDPQIVARVSRSVAVAMDQARSVLSEVPRLGPWVLLVIVAVFIQGGHRPLRLVFSGLSAGLGLAWGLAYCLWLLGDQGAMVLVSAPLAAAVAGCLAILAAYQTSSLRTIQAGLALALAALGVFLVPFPAASQLGMTLGLTALACSLALTTVYPGLLCLAGRRWPRILPASGAVEPEPTHELRRPVASLLILASLLVTAFCLSHPAEYDTDLIGLADPKAESMIPEMELEDGGRTALYATMVASDLDDAARIINRLNHLKSVGDVLGLPVLLPSDVEAKAPLAAEICAQLQGARLPRAIPMDTASDLLTLSAKLDRLSGKGPSLPEMEVLKKKLAPMGPGAIQDGLQAFQKGLLTDVGRVLDLALAQRPAPPTLEGVDPLVLNRLVGRTGKLNLMVFPKLPLRSAEVRITFMQQLRAVSPVVAGPAALIGRLGQSYGVAAQRAPWLAVALLFGLTLCALGNVPRAMLAMVVPVLSLVWTQGLMHLFRIAITPLNWPAQIVSLAMGTVLGLEAARQPSSRQVLLIPHLMAMIGFLALLGARHPAVSSLGFVATSGFGCNVLVALTVVPALESMALRAQRWFRR